jgi:hypothetical protein
MKGWSRIAPISPPTMHSADSTKVVVQYTTARARGWEVGESDLDMFLPSSEAFHLCKPPYKTLGEHIRKLICGECELSWSLTQIRAE